jgi:hypothetical protein
MDFENGHTEENKADATHTMPITWIASEAFAPQFVHGRVGVRLLLWDGVEAQWLNPVLSKSASWTGSLNAAADFK